MAMTERGRKTGRAVLALGWALVAFLGPLKTNAQDVAAVDSKKVGEFHALAVLTGDEDWRDKWNTPPEVVPEFGHVEELSLGDQAMLLVFFANPAVVSGRALIECDATISRPDGQVQDIPPFACYDDPVEGAPDNLRMAKFQVGIVVEPTDPSGLWQVDLGVRDTVRDIRVPLSIVFRVVAGGSG